ncbi:sarcolemmal membrane-associated protein [Leptopilina heterotoma]|uniref:sarcolemmal membrane-associated protein n=1 Tax=Leptopilina heterotoma TaxID=63436 RepID=UPI001CA96C85|nr:sarcolemmal membrane-associated protein [Leptopilina heterotoma]
MDLNLCYAILFSPMESPRKAATTMVVKNRLSILSATDNYVNPTKNATVESDTNLNLTNDLTNSELLITNDKMIAKGVLICRDNSHLFQDRTLLLDHPMKIGRSVARAKATLSNAIFDCKVLSRNHAILWYDSGKFYLQDTKSSNGTFVNNNRLSSSGQESIAREVCSGDIVQFGVNVVEDTKKLTHGCIVATLKLYLPDGKEAKASSSNSVDPVAGITFEDLYMLNQFVQEANRREQALQYKLSYLQQLVENTQIAANQSWKALIEEDRLLSRVETVESQLVFFSKNFAEDKVRNELVKLHEEKAQYQNAAKDALQKVLQEKIEVTHKLIQLETRLNETEEECHSLHEVTKHTQNELQELAAKYTEAQKKLQETTNKLMESDDKLQELTVKMEEEKKQFTKQIKDQARIERVLQAKLQNSKIDSINVHKQVTALKNYVRTLQDVKSKQLTDDNLESKDDINDVQMTMSGILNKLIYSTKPTTDIYDNIENNVTWQDNQVNSEDSEEMKNFDTDDLSYKDQINDSLTDSEKLKEYILPPSNRNLFNGTVNNDNLNISLDSDTDSEATEIISINSLTKESELNDSLTDSEKLDNYIILPPSRRTLIAGNFDAENLEISSGETIKSEADDPLMEKKEIEEQLSKRNFNVEFDLDNVFLDDNDDQHSNVCNVTSIHLEEKNDSTSSSENDNESPSKKLIKEIPESTSVDDCRKISDDCEVKTRAIVNDQESVRETCDRDAIVYGKEQELTENGDTLSKLEVRFASDEEGKQLERRFELEEKEEKVEEEERKEIDSGNNSSDSQDSPLNLIESAATTSREDVKNVNKSEIELENESMDGEYIKTLKPLSKSDSSQTVQVQEFILQSLIGCLDSLKEEDSQEAQTIVKRELKELKEWLMREQNEIILKKLKDIYYRSKNETQRMREVNEELVILKEKYNAFVEEKAELVKNYVTLKSQCGNLFNASYTVPIHYVAPLALVLIWMLIEKLF